MKNRYFSAILAGLIIALSSTQAFGMASSSQEDTDSYGKKALNVPARIIKETAKAYGVAMFSTYAHEIGHAIPATLLHKAPVRLFLGVNPDRAVALMSPEAKQKLTDLFAQKAYGIGIQQIGLTPFAGAAAHRIFAENASGFPSQALISAAGPLAGIASLYMLSKGIDIAQSYDKNKSMKEIFTDGMNKKTTLLSGKSAGLSVGFGYAFLENYANLMIALPGSDSYKMLSSLFPDKNHFDIACSVSNAALRMVVMGGCFIAAWKLNTMIDSWLTVDSAGELSKRMQAFESSEMPKDLMSALRSNKHEHVVFKTQFTAKQLQG